MKLDFPRKTTYIQIAGVTAFTHTVGNKKSLKWKKENLRWEKIVSQVAHKIHEITYGIFLFSIITEVYNM